MLQPVRLIEMLQRSSVVGAARTGGVLRFVRSMRSSDTEMDILGIEKNRARRESNDNYFSMVHHISNIVRTDFYLDRTLNKMRISSLVDSQLVYRVLRSCSKCGGSCLQFFNWARTHPNYNPTSLEFEELLKILAESCNWDNMWKIIHQMKDQDLPFSTKVVCYIIEHCGKKGLIDEAVDFFNKLNSLNCPQTTETYNSLLVALCEVKNFQGAYSLIRRMIRKGVTPDKRTYSTLVTGLCSAGKIKEAQEFLEEMSRRGFDLPFCGRDILLDGLVNVGHLETAKEMVRKMTTEGFVPDVCTFNSLAEAMCKAGEFHLCIDLFNDVCRSRFCPDLTTYKIIVNAASKEGRVNEALEVLHRSIEDGHRPFPSLYAPILQAFCKQGQFDDSLSLFMDMKMKGHPPHQPIYTMLIRLFVRGGRYVEAANYLMEMAELRFPPTPQIFDMVTKGLKKCGKHDLAKRIEHLKISLQGVD